MLIAAGSKVPFAVRQTQLALSDVTYQLAWPMQFDEPQWFWLLLCAVALAIAAIVVFIYWRDSHELSAATRILLAVLRLGALAGVALFALGLEKRTDHEVVYGSRVVLLVDVSQSMGFVDEDAPNQPATSRAGSRIGQVTDAFSQSPILEDLRRQHQVEVVAFDRKSRQVATLDRPTGDSADEAVRRVDWQEALQPHGTQTHLGDALLDALREDPASPLAAVAILSDGAHNAGVEPTAAAKYAKEIGIPVHTIGLGTTKPRKNVRVSNVGAPARAYPGDELSITASFVADGYPGWSVDAELLRQDATDTGAEPILVDRQQVQLASPPDIASAEFQLTPTETGTYTYMVRVVPPADDSNATDNQQEVDIEIVDRQLRVLLLAGGPTRDFRFLRNQLHRDPSVIVDVWLQTGAPGTSQDANELLGSFPESKQELYAYDCIVAFDPDWTALAREQVDMLESWVANEAGGLIAVAGPIHTAQWIRSGPHAKVRALYPVEFQQRLSILDDGHYGADIAWPIALTEEGQRAEFLQLSNTAVASQEAWASFPGVYGYFSVKGAKPGATVYGRFSDPEAGLSDELPVYLAGQFYGAGRTLYIGSGETWRLRAVDPGYFEVLFTKLLRYVSQGRLLRGSQLGTLLTDRDNYQLGDTIALKAQVSTPQHEPLAQPSITLQITTPAGQTNTLALQAESERPGLYTGEIVVLQHGMYRLDLPIPGAIDQQLTRRVRVRVPDLENRKAQRDEAVLASIARTSRGLYYPNMPAAIGGTENIAKLAAAIPDRSEIQTIEGAPDREFALAQSRWLLGVICGALLLEWLLRRLCRLA